MSNDAKIYALIAVAIGAVALVYLTWPTCRAGEIVVRSAFGLKCAAGHD